MPENTGSAVRLRVRLPRNARSVLRTRVRAARELSYPAAPFGLGPRPPAKVRGQARPQRGLLRRASGVSARTTTGALQRRPIARLGTYRRAVPSWGSFAAPGTEERAVQNPFRKPVSTRAAPHSSRP